MDLPYDWIVDNTRSAYMPEVYDNMEDALNNSVRTYRKNLWVDQNVQVEIWCEKEAVASTVLDVTWEYCVPLHVCKGQASLSFLYSSWYSMNRIGKPAYIYLFGRL